LMFIIGSRPDITGCYETASWSGVKALLRSSMFIPGGGPTDTPAA
jgi:hypothetical protein